MKNIPNELTKKYGQLKYSMSTGSDLWQDIKADFELEDDAFAGTLAYYDQGKIDISKVSNFVSDLQKFKQRVKKYNLKDDAEEQEKNILIEKISIALNIYQIVLDTFE